MPPDSRTQRLAMERRPTLIGGLSEVHHLATRTRPLIEGCRDELLYEQAGPSSRSMTHSQSLKVPSPLSQE